MVATPVAAGVHLRRLRCARRLHQLPDARQAGRPLRDDRRQLRRPGHRAEARQGGPAARRRDPRRSGLGGGPQGRRQIVKVNGRPVKGLTLDEAANRAPGDRGERRSSWPCAGEGRPIRSHRLVRRHVEVESVTRREVVDPAAGIGYLRLDGLPEDVGRRDRRGDRRPAAPGDASPGARPAGQSGRPARTSPSRSPSGSSTRG